MNLELIQAVSSDDELITFALDKDSILDTEDGVFASGYCEPYYGGYLVGYGELSVDWEACWHTFEVGFIFEENLPVQAIIFGDLDGRHFYPEGTREYKAVKAVFASATNTALTV